MKTVLIDFGDATHETLQAGPGPINENTLQPGPRPTACYSQAVIGASTVADQFAGLLDSPAPQLKSTKSVTSVTAACIE